MQLEISDTRGLAAVHDMCVRAADEVLASRKPKNNT